jgi:hypothetical protein
VAVLVASTPRVRDVLIGICVAAATLVLYILTLQPDFGGPEDTPKFQFIGYVLGVPHPPGYPLYVLLSHPFSALPIGTIAYRANLFSAVMAAMACALSYAIGRQLGAHRWTAFCAALGLATGASFWRSAVFAEVYSLAAVMAGLTISLLLAWGARGGTTRLVSAFGAFAFALGNHLTIIGIIPSFAAYVLTRGRRIWSARMIAASAALLGLGLAQYGLIMLRTRQSAPYVEIGAYTVHDLIAVVTAERFAEQRFAFGPGVLLTEHLPALLSLIARELGAAGTVLVISGVGAGIRRGDGALVLGAAAGMLAMVLNISGDLRGFITPLMVLLWPLTAIGIDAVADYTRARAAMGGRLAAALLAAAVILPAANLTANYREADQSTQTGEARFHRALFRQLPDGSRFVTEDYRSDMAWRYYRLTGEAGAARGTERVDFDRSAVRRAAAEGHRVFGFGFASPPLAEWLAALPRGSVVVAATAFSPFPADLSVVGHAGSRPPGRPQSFEAFAVIAGERGNAWKRADDEVSLRVDGEALRDRVPGFAGSIVAASGRAGARVDLEGRTVARVDSGVALAVFAPDGTLLRTFDLAPGEAPRVAYDEAVYELVGESPCAALTTTGWTEAGAVLASGGWIATMASVGSIVIDTMTPSVSGVLATSTPLLGDGSINSTISSDPRGDIVTTTMTRPGESRPVFRLAFDRMVSKAQARVRPGGAQSSATICAFEPMRPVFARSADVGVLKPDFESEPYFGAGWGGAQRAPSGAQRRGSNGATLFVPLEQETAYRLLLEFDRPVILEVMLNGAPVGSCADNAGLVCEIALPPAMVRRGPNTLRFMLRARADDRGDFLFRGARIIRSRSVQ